MQLMRQAVRDAIVQYVDESDDVELLRSIVLKFAPKTPQHFKNPRQLSTFKREQREFDKLLLDFHLVDPAAIEERNSVVSPRCKIRILELE